MERSLYAEGEMILRTWVLIPSADTRRRVFTEACIRELESLSAVDWAETDRSYSEEDLLSEIGRYDAVITGWGSPKLTARVLAEAGQLRFIGHTAGTLRPYVDPAVFQTDIKVVNANSILAESTAELTIGLMLAGAWNFRGYHREMQQGRWKEEQPSVSGLSGQEVGLIGYGEVSRQVIRKLQAFNARISLNTPYCSTEEAEELGVILRTKEDILRRSQIISLHDTLTAQTRGMIGSRELNMIRDGALLVNTARGPLIDEQALMFHAESRRFFIALDVYHEEPLAKDSPLLQLPNVLCTPHIGGVSRYWTSQQSQVIVNELGRLMKGEPQQRRISLEQFQRMSPH